MRIAIGQISSESGRLREFNDEPFQDRDCRTVFGGRADLVKQEQEEIAIISGYLPKQMSEAEMAAARKASK